MAQASLRIGELSRRTGVTVERLRAWERRYGLMRPSRSAGGFRLYSAADERRVRLMQEQLGQGLAAAEAARAALAGADEAAVAEPGSAVLEEGRQRLGRALDAMDDRAAQAAFDSLLANFTLETVLGGAVLPYLADLGDRWARGEATVAQEHVASSLIRGRLLGLARGWDSGSGPRALLACAPGELHDLALIAFGLVIARNGWRVSFLGPDTPIETLADADAVLRPKAIVLVATSPDRLRGGDELLARMARTTRLYLAGRGATEERANALGAQILRKDPVSAGLELA